MARRISRQSREQKLMHVWWVRAGIALVFLGIAYGFASLAIDSGNLFEYAACVIFLWWGLEHIVRSVRYAFVR